MEERAGLADLLPANGQQKKVEKLIRGLHEDLQHDYLQEIELLR